MPSSAAAFPASLKRSLLATAFIGAALSSAPAFAGLGYAPGPLGMDYYSYQNILIGATQSLQQSANNGQGVTVGTIDTGITSGWVGFSGLNVSSNSCLGGTCAPTIANSDDNGHGTFVAGEIAGGVQFTNGNGMLGVAPLANVVAVKVLNAQGSGNSVDVANGIRYAVDNGAQVLNLSLGPTGTWSQQVAFYNSLASAIDYATAKGAVIVFAGGNTGTNFVGGAKIGSATNLAGNLFTDTALQHMIFVGATNSKKAKTSYSSLPGQATAGFYSSTGKFYSYRSMWVMADGGGLSGSTCIDCIVGAPNVVGANYLMLSAGTSMAAPEVTGAAALLAARWPQLLTQGTIPALLEQTATDLGTTGMDALYGNGFINLQKAFQPVGTLSAITGSGGSVTIGSGSTSVLTSGALGSMSRVSAALSNYTAFDSFKRDFAVNLSGMVATRQSSSPAGQQVSAPAISTSATHFADGSSLSFGNIADNSPADIESPAGSNRNKGWFMSFTDAAGTTMAAGSGISASASFAGAMWGADAPASGSVAALGASGSLLNLAQGGSFFALGDSLGGTTRMALSWSQTDAASGTTSDWSRPDATAFSGGISTRITNYWKGGVTFGMLDERAGLLGTTYAANGPLSLGDSNRSMSLGVSSVFALGDSSELVVDAAVARSGGSQGNGIISSISSLYAHSYGAALVERDTLRSGDNLSFSVRSPLRVFSGSADLTTASVDSNGSPVIGSQRVSLAPNASELDFGATYSAPLSEQVSWNISVDARRNAGNIASNNDEDILVGTKISF